MKTGIVVFAHGSSVASANRAVEVVAGQMARDGGFDLVIAAFLEQARPDLREAVESLVGQGARRVLVIPYFLTLGIHLQRDLPRIAGELAGAHPGVEIRVTNPLDGHPALAAILVGRAREALDAWGGACSDPPRATEPPA